VGKRCAEARNRNAKLKVLLTGNGDRFPFSIGQRRAGNLVRALPAIDGRFYIVGQALNSRSSMQFEGGFLFFFLESFAIGFKVSDDVGLSQIGLWLL